MKKLFIVLMSIMMLFCPIFTACEEKDGGGDAETFTVTINVDNKDYGTVNKTSISNVAKDTAIIVDASTLTIGTETVTATPAVKDAQYTYRFDGFTYSGTTVNGNMTITAKFSRTLNGNDNEKTFSIIFKLKTDDYSFTYNSSTEDVIKRVSDGETLGDDFLILNDNQEIQNQEYKIVGWYYYDKDDNQKTIDKDTIISTENLNIADNVDEIYVYAKIKKLWL